MTRVVIVDTGPLLAFLDRRDRWHDWTRQTLSDLRPPLLTCEAVLTEACYLASRMDGGLENMLGVFQRGAARIAFTVEGELSQLADLTHRHANVPMSFADACLVRMCEHCDDAAVLTLDSDFRIYRKHRRRKIPLIIPDGI